MGVEPWPDPIRVMDKRAAFDMAVFPTHQSTGPAQQPACSSQSAPLWSCVHRGVVSYSCHSASLGLPMIGLDRLFTASQLPPLTTHHSARALAPCQTSHPPHPLACSQVIPCTTKLPTHTCSLAASTCPAPAEPQPYRGCLQMLLTPARPVRAAARPLGGRGVQARELRAAASAGSALEVPGGHTSPRPTLTQCVPSRS
jgi:hypothetical protein